MSESDIRKKQPAAGRSATKLLSNDTAAIVHLLRSSEPGRLGCHTVTVFYTGLATFSEPGINTDLGGTSAAQKAGPELAEENRHFLTQQRRSKNPPKKGPENLRFRGLLRG